MALAQMTIRPSEWADDGGGGEVGAKFEHQKILHTLHVISVDGQEQSIEVDAAGKSLSF